MRSPGLSSLSSLTCGVAVAALCLGLTGCNNSASGPAVYPVTGKVLVDGEPRAGLAVIFLPDSTKGTTGMSANATTDSEGRFSLNTLTADGDKPGVSDGHYIVTVACPFGGSDPSGQSAESSTPCAIAPKYSNYQATPLSAEVKADASAAQEFTFEVTSS